MESVNKGSNLFSLSFDELISSVEHLELNENETVEVDCEVPSHKTYDLFNSEMVKLKQTARKGADFNEDRNGGKLP